ncbi:MAG TPA: hypothetical protein VJ813_19025 [Vicinamibacterales bacterium]|nr:hypothetical protein [Vicinamibacterales bacterium]
MPSQNPKVNAVMQILVSVIVLVAGILALTAPNFFFHAALSEGTQKMAAGWVGLVIGYWLS